VPGVNLVARGVWLVAVWVALWGDVSVANVLSGTALAVLVLVVFPVHGGPRRGVSLRPVATARLVGYFLRTLVASNVALTRAVLSRDDRLCTGVVEVRMICDSDGLLTILNHLIALTPGTTVIEVERDPPRVYVHVLQLTDIDSARAAVQQLELLVIEAFGSSDLVQRARRARRATATSTELPA
jgi:multicomponent Na+:H+ antiporter subunit E